MFTPEIRSKIRNSILQIAEKDDRISGCAITGSVTIGKEDQWSDIDLAFGCKEEVGITPILNDFTKNMQETYDVLHTLDVPSGKWIYRVFFLANTLQVDLAFAPESDFGAKAETFKLVSGKAQEPSWNKRPDFEYFAGWGWLNALHARTSIARKKYWQAEYFISGMRDQVISLACLRNGKITREGRGVDELSDIWKKNLTSSLVKSLDKVELQRAFSEISKIYLDEISRVDADLAARLKPAIFDLIAQNEEL